MKSAWEKIAESAKDAKAFAEQASESGITFLRSHIGRIPLFSSTYATVNQTTERDETHYFLIPFRSAKGRSAFALYTTRSLPLGIGPVNSLEKARIFHLHDEAGVEVLEKMLTQRTKAKLVANSPAPDSNIANHLDELAVQIDRYSHAATGGLLIVGTLVALSNPVIGAGIAAKALFPSIGKAATTSGIQFFSKKLKEKSLLSHEEKTQKAAELETKHLKAETRINPILKQWQTLLVLETEDSTSDFDLWRLEMGGLDSIRLTEKAITAVHREYLNLALGKGPLRKHERVWLEELTSIVESTNKIT